MGVGLFVGIWVACYLGPEQLCSKRRRSIFAIATPGLDGIVVSKLVKGEYYGVASLIVLTMLVLLL